MCVCESATEKGAADALDSPVTRLAYRQGHTPRSAAPFLIIDTAADDGVSKRLTLKKGPNVIRAAIVNGGGATDFCARFLDAEDRPPTALTIRLR